MEGTHFSIIKALYNKPTANIIHIGEKQSFFSKIRKKTRMLTFTSFIKYILEFLARMTRQ